jgi:hypothetical protein
MLNEVPFQISQLGSSSVVSTTFQTTDAPQIIADFYTEKLQQQGLSPEVIIPADNEIYLTFLQVVERFPFASLFTPESNRVTSVHIIIQPMKTNRTLVRVIKTELFTYPSHADYSPSLNP